MGLANQRAAYAKGHSDQVTLKNVTLGKETEKAILATIEGTDYWMPLSQVHKIVRSPNKGCDELVVSQWIAEQKGLA